ncbi:MAG: tetratricopeptide repeat protein [Candidatus Solibacter sp.]|nr:tetratricopeptide repeat protein [Candidatus Solibacter sp.]
MRRLILCLMAAGAALAQHHDMATPAETPVTLYKGLGNWKHPIATRSEEAQRYFDQGLALLYGFNRYEALRSFRKASELDPQAAMAFWGMAMSTGPYINMGVEGDGDLDSKAACVAVGAGLKIAGTPARDRAYLEAASTRCPEYKPDAYVVAMKSLAERYPDDLDAATLYAESLMVPVRWHWYASDGTAAPGVPEAERVLQSVLRRWPSHAGANHYFIHAVESSPAPERGIPSAQQLMGVVPWAGHIVHMPGHIWLALGDYEMAGSVNERASAVDREYFAATKVIGAYAMYYAHNLHFVAYARSMQGRRTDTVKAAQDLAEAVAPAAEAMPEMADAFLSVPLLLLTRVQAWDEILKSPQPAEKFVTQGALWRYARMMAMLGKGDSAGAARERDAFEAARKRVAADRPWGNNTCGDVMAMVSEIAAARMGDKPVQHWEKAVAMQDALVYDEPPAWNYPLRESLGAALVRAGRPADAEKVFREGLRRSPRDAWMIFGLIEAVKAQQKTEGLVELQHELDAAWGKADIKLTLGAM